MVRSSSGGEPVAGAARRIRAAFDGPVWRAVELGHRVVNRIRGTRADRRRRRTRGEVAAPELRHPSLREVEAINADMDRAVRVDEVAWVTRALALALREGAYATAGGLADYLSVRPGDFDRPEMHRALPLVLESLLARGEREKARALALGHRPVLRRSARGTGLLTVLDCDGPQDGLRLPDGRPNPLAVCRRIDEGSLAPARVVELLLERRSLVLDDPQLHLIAHRAFREIDWEAATAALNRFLRVQSLPTCAMTGSTGNLLRDLRFRPRASRRSGPLVSVVIPARNAASTIGYAVDSILAQTHANLEVLVCDDGSEDDTLERLLDRGRGDRRIRVFSSRRAQGPYNVRNHLIERARGAFIAFHDADDLSLPTRIETQVRTLERAGAVACVSNWVRVTPDGRFVFFRDRSAVRLAIVSLFAPRSTFRAVGPFRSARFGADLELFENIRARWGEQGVARVREPLLFGLWSESSVTRGTGSESLEDGYRAPARRDYSERAFRARLLGDGVVDEASMLQALRASDNFIPPDEISEHGSP